MRKSLRKSVRNTYGKIAKLFFSGLIAMTCIFSFVLPSSAEIAPPIKNDIQVLNAGISTPPSAASPTATADTTFTNVIKFAAVWMGRIGLVVAFVGAFMFFMAMKDNNADGKQTALMVLVAGFGAFAVTGSLSMFGIV
jgi:hypothetical protein